MNQAISEILTTIPAGYVFDAHFVISQLIKFKSDEYIHFATPNQTTAQMHSSISKMIKDQPNIEYVGDNFYSENIHATPSKNYYYRKIG